MTPEARPSRSSGAASPVGNGEGHAIEVKRRLRSSPYLGLRRVRCEYHQGALVLEGRVSSYHCKQLAQELAKDIDRTIHVVNRLVVSSAESDARSSDDGYACDPNANMPRTDQTDGESPLETLDRVTVCTVFSVFPLDASSFAPAGVATRPR